MPAPKFAEKELLSAHETAVFALSQNPKELSTYTLAQLHKEIAYARSLRDRARDMYRRQVGKTRSVTSTKRGYSGMANERTRQKAEVLDGVVERLTAARAAAL